ncbi:hypothetical protein [Actinoplanes utahensis]|uniref:Lipoprotein n=1 Tax=Actinoplanes utahensis TaxID=1869 RepID=A0A0A6UAN6_ACTUT|nr:hypothetical protein [Actinoplanes utahensis]KHD72128.1 hypothetical protein MB27_41485 [Actinoplanes utahensis]GIF27634.1 hypothetical protein Aut01nite_06200 [Actinoplanes utahensis]
MLSRHDLSRSHRIVPLLAVLLTAGCVGPPSPDSPAPAAPAPSYPVVVDEFTTILNRTRAAPYAYRVQGDLPAGQNLTASGAYDAKAGRLVAERRLTGGDLPGGFEALRVDGAKTWVRSSARLTWTSMPGAADMSDPMGLSRFAEAIQDVRSAGPGLYWVYVQPGESSITAADSFLPIGAPGSVQVFSRLGGAVRVNVTTDAAGWITAFTMEAQSLGKTHRIVTTLSDHGRPVIVPPVPR